MAVKWKKAWPPHLMYLCDICGQANYARHPQGCMDRSWNERLRVVRVWPGW